MLPAEILKLPLDQRIQLVEDIWDSIAEIPEAIVVSDDHRRELDSLLDDYHKDPSAGSPWPEVRKRIVGK